MRHVSFGEDISNSVNYIGNSDSAVSGSAGAGSYSGILKHSNGYIDRSLAPALIRNEYADSPMYIRKHQVR